MSALEQSVSVTPEYRHVEKVVTPEPRQALNAVRTLRRSLAGLELSERMRSDAGRALEEIEDELRIPDPDRGVVTAVDPERRRIDVDLGGRRVSLPRAFLEQPTRHGGRSLMHGYAMTVHLAQGMTCDRTFVLVGDQLTREAGYVALSRGRQSNRLYVLDSPESERDEFAPAGPGRQDPVRALVESLRRSRRQTMATDRAADRAEELHVELAALLARHEPTLTENDRDTLVRLEESYGWRPGRRPVRPEPTVRYLAVEASPPA